MQPAEVADALIYMLTRFRTVTIRVNALAPGYIQTDMSQGGIDNPALEPCLLWTVDTQHANALNITGG